VTVNYDEVSYYKRPWRGWVEVSGFDAPACNEWLRADDEPFFSVEAGLAIAGRILAAHPTLAARIVDAGGNVYETLYGIGYLQKTVDKSGEPIHVLASERLRLLQEALSE
jgi:hypothetical protein